ncbi:endo alpha-1,4 polygalactosaminidase, partial [Burkholderia sp. Ax-1735]|nr:endo alpha-1,4 polygalactosaminidase [Burkholderia sp. Ax-1735]
MKKTVRNLSCVAALALCASILQACGDGSSDPLSARAFAAPPPAAAAPAR